MAKRIIVAHQKGGVGKSTIAFNLAINLSRDAKVAILDMDYQGSLVQLEEKFEEIHITSDKVLLSNDSNYDFIIVDTPPYLSNELPKLIIASDLILVPTKAGILDILAITTTIDLIKKQKMDHKALIVFNMIKPNTTLTQDIMGAVVPMDIRVAKTKISDLVSFTRSVALDGVAYDAKAQFQLDSLTKEVLNLLLQNTNL